MSNCTSTGSELLNNVITGRETSHITLPAVPTHQVHSVSEMALGSSSMVTNEVFTTNGVSKELSNNSILTAVDSTIQKHSLTTFHGVVDQERSSEKFSSLHEWKPGRRSVKGLPLPTMEDSDQVQASPDAQILLKIAQFIKMKTNSQGTSNNQHDIINFVEEAKEYIGEKLVRISAALEGLKVEQKALESGHENFQNGDSLLTLCQKGLTLMEYCRSEIEALSMYDKKDEIHNTFKSEERQRGSSVSGTADVCEQNLNPPTDSKRTTVVCSLCQIVKLNNSDNSACTSCCNCCAAAFGGLAKPLSLLISQASTASRESEKPQTTASLLLFGLIIRATVCWASGILAHNLIQRFNAKEWTLPQCVSNISRSGSRGSKRETSTTGDPQNEDLIEEDSSTSTPPSRCFITDKVNCALQHNLHPMVKSFLFSDSLDSALQRIESARYQMSGHCSVDDTGSNEVTQGFLLRAWNSLCYLRGKPGQLNLTGYPQEFIDVWSELPIYQGLLTRRNERALGEVVSSNDEMSSASSADRNEEIKKVFQKELITESDALLSAQSVIHLLMKYANDNREHSTTNKEGITTNDLPNILQNDVRKHSNSSVENIPSGRYTVNRPTAEDSESFFNHFSICAIFIIRHLQQLMKEKLMLASLIEHGLQQFFKIGRGWLCRHYMVKNNFGIEDGNEAAELLRSNFGTEPGNQSTFLVTPESIISLLPHMLASIPDLSETMTIFEQKLLSHFRFSNVPMPRKATKPKALSKFRNSTTSASETKSEMTSSFKAVNAETEVLTTGDTKEELRNSSETDRENDLQNNNDAEDVLEREAEKNDDQEAGMSSPPSMKYEKENEEVQFETDLSDELRQSLWVPPKSEVSDTVIYRNRSLAFNSWLPQLLSLQPFSLVTFRKCKPPTLSSAEFYERSTIGAPFSSSVTWLPPGRRHLLFSADSSLPYEVQSSLPSSTPPSLHLNCYAVVDDRVVLYLDPQCLPEEVISIIELTNGEPYICRWGTPSSLLDSSERRPSPLNASGSLQLLSFSELQNATVEEEKGQYFLPPSLFFKSAAVGSFGDVLSERKANSDGLCGVNVSLNFVNSLDELLLPYIQLDIAFKHLVSNRSLEAAIEMTLSVPRQEFWKHYQLFSDDGKVPPWCWDAAPSLQRYLNPNFVRVTIEPNYLSLDQWVAELAKLSRKACHGATGTRNVIQTRGAGRKEMNRITTSDSESGSLILKSPRLTRKARKGLAGTRFGVRRFISRELKTELERETVTETLNENDERNEKDLHIYDEELNDETLIGEEDDNDMSESQTSDDYRQRQKDTRRPRKRVNKELSGQDRSDSECHGFRSLQCKRSSDSPLDVNFISGRCPKPPEETLERPLKRQRIGTTTEYESETAGVSTEEGEIDRTSEGWPDYETQRLLAVSDQEADSSDFQSTIKKVKYGDSQKFLYVWDIKKSELGCDGQMPSPLSSFSLAGSDDRWKGLTRVSYHHRKILKEKLQLLNQSVLFARRLYKRWKRSVRRLDLDRLFCGDLFAWGVLPARALQHPEQWVPLPAGYQRGKRFSSYEASTDIDQSRFQLYAPTLCLSGKGPQLQVESLTKRVDEISMVASSLCEQTCRPLAPPVAPQHHSRVVCPTSYDNQGPPTLPLPSRRYDSKNESQESDYDTWEVEPSPKSSPLVIGRNSSDTSRVGGRSSARLQSISQISSVLLRNLRWDPSSVKLKLVRAFGFVDKPCSVSELHELNYVAAAMVKVPALWTLIGRTPFPLLRSSMAVQCQLEEERRRLMGGVGLRGTGTSSMVMRSQDCGGFAELLGLSRGASEGDSGASTGHLCGVTAGDQRVLNAAGSSGRDWLHSGHENLTGPPPKWRNSSLFRMGKDTDYYFNQPTKFYYINENLRDSYPTQTDADLACKVYWSEQEIQTFLTRYIVTPKDFKKIAQAMNAQFGQKALGVPELSRNVNVAERDMRGKTENHCADFYYRFKYFFELKRTIRELKPGKLTLKNKSNSRPPKKPLTRTRAVERLMKRLRYTYRELLLFTSRLADLRQRRQTENCLAASQYGSDRTLKGQVRAESITQLNGTSMRMTVQSPEPRSNVASNSSIFVEAQKDISTLFDEIYSLSMTSTCTSISPIFNDPHLEKDMCLPEFETRKHLHMEASPNRFYSLTTLHAISAFYILKTLALKQLPARVLSREVPPDVKPSILEIKRVSLETPQEGYIVPESVLALVPAQKPICIPQSLAASDVQPNLVHHLVLLSRDKFMTTDKETTNEAETNSYIWDSPVPVITDSGSKLRISRSSRSPRIGPFPTSSKSGNLPQSQDAEVARVGSPVLGSMEPDGSVVSINQLLPEARAEVRLKDISAAVILRRLADLAKVVPVGPASRSIPSTSRGDLRRGTIADIVKDEEMSLLEVEVLTNDVVETSTEPRENEGVPGETETTELTNIAERSETSKKGYPHTDASDEQVAVSELSHLLWSLRRRKETLPQSLEHLAMNQSPAGFTFVQRSVPSSSPSSEAQSTPTQATATRGLSSSRSDISNSTAISLHTSNIDIRSIETYVTARQSFADGKYDITVGTVGALLDEVADDVGDFERNQKKRKFSAIEMEKNSSNVGSLNKRRESNNSLTENETGRTKNADTVVRLSEPSLVQTAIEQRRVKKTQKRMARSQSMASSVSRQCLNEESEDLGARGDKDDITSDGDGAVSPTPSVNAESKVEGEKRHRKHKHQKNRQAEEEKEIEPGDIGEEQECRKNSIDATGNASRSVSQESQYENDVALKQEDVGDKHRKHERGRHHHSHRRDSSSRKGKRREQKTSKPRVDSTSSVVASSPATAPDSARLTNVPPTTAPPNPMGIAPGGYRSLWFGPHQFPPSSHQFGAPHIPGASAPGFLPSALYDAYNVAATVHTTGLHVANIHHPFSSHPFGIRPLPAYYADFAAAASAHRAAAGRGIGLPLPGYDIFGGYRSDASEAFRFHSASFGAGVAPFPSGAVPWQQQSQTTSFTTQLDQATRQPMTTTATASPSISASATASPSISASATASPSISAAATASPSIPASATASPSISASATASPSISPSAIVTLDQASHQQSPTAQSNIAVIVSGGESSTSFTRTSALQNESATSVEEICGPSIHELAGNQLLHAVQEPSQSASTENFIYGQLPLTGALAKATNKSPPFASSSPVLCSINSCAVQESIKQQSEHQLHGFIDCETANVAEPILYSIDANQQTMVANTSEKRSDLELPTIIALSTPAKEQNFTSTTVAHVSASTLQNQSEVSFNGSLLPSLPDELLPTQLADATARHNDHLTLPEFIAQPEELLSLPCLEISTLEMTTDTTAYKEHLVPSPNCNAHLQAISLYSEDELHPPSDLSPSSNPSQAAP